MSACRVCGATGLVPILDLGAMPLANAFVQADDSSVEARFPLALLFCPACHVGQLSETVAPAKLFADYAYLSSTSTTMVEHARALVERLIRERALNTTSRVVEIASNDGYLLQHYVAREVPVVGVEPASHAASLARAKGIETVEAFFDEALGQRLARDGTADVLHAHNVLAHVPEPHSFLEGIAALIGPRGVAAIEVPDARVMLERCLFDTIYHEHVFIFTLSSLHVLAARHRLAVVDAERVSIHGGSLRVFLARADGDGVDAQGLVRVAQLLDEERAAGAHDVEAWRRFGARVSQRVRTAHQWLEQQAAAGLRVAAYGAAAKGTVFLNALQANARLVEFVVDKAATKQGKRMPGVGIPVRSPDALIDTMPDAVVVLAWNLIPEILAEQSAYRVRGGRFFVFEDTVREL